MQKIDQKSVDRLEECASELNSLFADAEKVMDEARAAIAEIMSKAEEVREDAFSILDDARNEAETFYDEKSERWQEGERGQIYDEWKNRLAEVADQLAEPIEEPEFPEMTAPDWVGDLENAGDFSAPNY